MSSKQSSTPIATSGLSKKERLFLYGGMFFVYLLFGIILKLGYPIPIDHADVGGYLISARDNMLSIYRPFGYSWFFQVLHSLNDSMNTLFMVQYMLFMLSGFGMVFTLEFHQIIKNKGVLVGLAILMITEPTALYLTNYMVSDSLFSPIGLLLIAGIFWMIQLQELRWKLVALTVNLFLLYILFYLRYAAYVHVVLLSLSCLFAFKNVFYKLIAATLPLALIFLVIRSITFQMEMEYQIRSYSPFSGWALTNNAVSMIPEIRRDNIDFADSTLEDIHQHMLRFADSTYSWTHIKATHFMWYKNFPGKTYMTKMFRERNKSYVWGWGRAGLNFQDYGKALIQKFPFEYASMFLIPNAKQLFQYHPYHELNIYKPDELQKTWFALPFSEFTFENQWFDGNEWYSKGLFYLRWIIFFAAIILLVFLLQKSVIPWKEERVLWISLLFLIGYYVFSVISHPINNFRYLAPTYAIMYLVIAIISGYAVRFFTFKKSEQH
jgi:hypothetical protein